MLKWRMWELDGYNMKGNYDVHLIILYPTVNVPLNYQIKYDRYVSECFLCCIEL